MGSERPVSDSSSNAVQDTATQREECSKKNSLGFLCDDVLLMIFDQLIVEDDNGKSGKLELLAIMRCTDPISNERRFRELGNRALYKSVSLLPQRLILFHRTILARPQLASYVQSIELCDLDREPSRELVQAYNLLNIRTKYHSVPALVWLKYAALIVGKLTSIKSLHLKDCTRADIISNCKKLLSQETLQTLKHLSFSSHFWHAAFGFELLRFLPQQTRLQSLSGCCMPYKIDVQAKSKSATLTALRMRETTISTYNVDCFSEFFPQLDTLEFVYDAVMHHFKFVRDCLAPLKTRLRSLTLHLSSMMDQIETSTCSGRWFSERPWSKFSSLEYLSVSAKLFPENMETLALELPTSLKHLQVVHCNSAADLEGLIVFLKTINNQKESFSCLQELDITVAVYHKSFPRVSVQVKEFYGELIQSHFDRVRESPEDWGLQSLTPTLITLSDLCDTMNIKFRYARYFIIYYGESIIISPRYHLI